MKAADGHKPGGKSRRERAQRSALSRFGLEMGKQVRRELMRRVWRGEVKYARKMTCSRTVIVLDYGGQEMAFIYSRSSKEILCFLEPDAPETAGWRNSKSAARALFRSPAAGPAD